MAETVVLEAQARTDQGTRASRKLRKGGRVPAVLYGHKEATLSLTLSGEDLYKAIRRGARLVDLKQNGNVEKALIREVQWDPLGHDILHVDFARVAADERITLDVRIELRGTAPGVTAGGAIVQPLHDLSVECLVVSIPESIRVNIGELQIDQAIHVRDLTLPPGVVAMNDPDAIVVQVVPPRVEAEPTAVVPGAAEQAEPELIGRQKPEEEEEEAE